MADLSDDQLRQLCEALGWQGGTFWQALEEVRRQRAAITASVAVGWKLVPVEPTPEMMTAVDDAYGDGGDFPDMWAAALAAAPISRQRGISDEQIDAVARSLGISYGGRQFDIRSIARAVAGLRSGEFTGESQQESLARISEGY